MGAAVVPKSETWVKGKATRGTRAVAARGMASVTHHLPMRVSTAAVTASPWAVNSAPSGAASMTAWGTWSGITQ